MAATHCSPFVAFPIRCSFVCSNLLPILQRTLHRGTERIRGRTIQHAMIITKTERQHRLEGQIIPGVGFERATVTDHDRALFNRTGAEDADLRLDNHRRLEAAAGGAVVADREGAVLQIFATQLVLARLLGQLIDGAG